MIISESLKHIPLAEINFLRAEAMETIGQLVVHESGNSSLSEEEKSDIRYYLRELAKFESYIRDRGVVVADLQGENNPFRKEDNLPQAIEAELRKVAGSIERYENLLPEIIGFLDRTKESKDKNVLAERERLSEILKEGEEQIRMIDFEKARILKFLGAIFGHEEIIKEQSQAEE